MLREPGGELDVVGANRQGQQLFLADLFQQHSLRVRNGPTQRSDTPPHSAPIPMLRPARHQQLALFNVRHDLAAHGRVGLSLRADPVRAAALESHARQLAAQRGWSTRLTQDTCHGIRIVLGIQDSADAAINASDVALLSDLELPVWPVLEVLSDVGCLAEDRTPAIDMWVDRQLEGMPEPMSSELRTWFTVMKHGSPTPPRRRPRAEATINLHLRWALPTLQAWAADGHTSLREITREQVLDALPASGNPRSTTGQGLKSIFRLLKSRKLLIPDPTARVKTGQHEARQPLPVDLALVREALHSAEPARAAVVALTAFHGIRTGPLQRLQLTDVRDGRLYVEGRIIVLADPVRERLTAYLDYRNRRWPNSTNPYLFVHYRSAGRSEPVGKRWIWLTVGPGLSAAALREDRILNETHATAGDVRRLADLFGLSINASIRYATTLDHPDLIHTETSDRTRH